MKQRHENEWGVALVTVMLILVICAVVAVSIFSRQQIDAQRTGNLLEQAQAYHYALGAEELARQVLAVDAVQDAGVDHRGESWARLREGVPVEHGDLTFRLEDLQGRFNLNTLMYDNATQRMRFTALLGVLGLPSSIASGVVERVGTKQAPRPLMSVSQLREVEGVTSEAYEVLQPFVAVLPESTSALNVNTASETVMKAYFSNHKEYDRMKTVLTKRGYITEEELNAIGMNTKGTVVRSSYFQLMAAAQIDGRSATLVSMIRRRIDEKKRIQMDVIVRDRGQHFARVE